MSEAPVWVWLPDTDAPVKAGTIYRDDNTGAGAFQYEAAYLVGGGTALDPDQLRHRDARRPIRIPAAHREGVPGIIADAGPDAWGRRVLAQDLGFEPNALEALMHSADDGAGNLSVGDLANKPPIEWLDLPALAEAIQRRQEGLPYKEVNRKVDLMLSPDTALGGAKPKATTMVEGVPWIAKFPERGDPPNLPYYEAAALRLATRLGIDSSRAEVHALPRGRAVLLVKRFDRKPEGTRLPMASALTVLGPAAQAIGPARTYLRLARALRVWTREGAPYPSVQRLWERVAYNALVGNIDDHPRNHALLQVEGQWQLSPIYDVVPTFITRERAALAMPFLAETPTRLTAAISAANLVRAAPAFGISTEEALNKVVTMASQIIAGLPEVLSDLGAAAIVGPQMQPLLDWAGKLMGEAHALSAADLSPQRQRRRGWNWAP